MKSSLVILALFGAAPAVRAFPAAPDYSLYGVVRNEGGRPLATGEGVVIVSGAAGELTRSPVDAARGLGLNYTVHIPMDAGTLSGLYQVTALRPAMPFTIAVKIGSTSYVPIQMSGGSRAAGKPGERVRLDLTLGEDSDGDGLADSWETALIESDESGRLRSLADVTAAGDPDSDGLTNLQEFHLGTYALDRLDGLSLEIVEVRDGRARLRFATVKGRTYFIRASATLTDWQQVPLSFTAAGEGQIYFRAETTGVTDVFVPVPEDSAGKQLFRLYAE